MKQGWEKRAKNCLVYHTFPHDTQEDFFYFFTNRCQQKKSFLLLLNNLFFSISEL